jgi:hypothetical protein
MEVQWKPNVLAFHSAASAQAERTGLSEIDCNEYAVALWLRPSCSRGKVQYNSGALR